MLNEGICDELTNHQRCIFDGGDCCRQNKSTELCSVCTCKLNTAEEQLNDDYESLDVRVFHNMDTFTQQNIKIVATVEDVQSFQVCSRICMDADRYSLVDDWKILMNRKASVWRKDVNAWMFRFDNRTCTCLTLLSASFCPPMGNLSLVPAQDFVYEHGFLKGIVFLQMTRLPDCGKFPYSFIEVSSTWL